MIPYKSPLLTAVPRTLEKRLEIVDAIRALAAPNENERLAKRHAELASIRRDLGELAQTLQEIRRDCDPRLRSYVIKYSPDQPRVPAGHPDGGQWTSEGGSGPSGDSSLSDRTGNDDPSISSNGVSEDISEPGAQYAALGTGTQSGAADAVPSNSESSDDSPRPSQEMSADVIYICVLEPSQPWSNSCVYWCHHGFLLARQRNPGLACPSIVIEPDVP